VVLAYSRVVVQNQLLVGGFVSRRLGAITAVVAAAIITLTLTASAEQNPTAATPRPGVSASGEGSYRMTEPLLLLLLSAGFFGVASWTRRTGAAE
jgi:hypothetical protein